MPKIYPETVSKSAKIRKKLDLKGLDKTQVKDIQTVDKMNLQMLYNLPGWNTFNWEEKHFLSALKYYSGNEYKAACFIKHQTGSVPRNWLDHRKRVNPLFAQAIEERQMHPILAAVQLGEAAATMAVGAFLDILQDKKANNTDRISAAKEVLKINRMYPGLEKDNEDAGDIQIELKGNFWLTKEQLAQQQMKEIEGKVVTNEEYSEEEKALT